MTTNLNNETRDVNDLSNSYCITQTLTFGEKEAKLLFETIRGLGCAPTFTLDDKGLKQKQHKRKKPQEESSIVTLKPESVSDLCRLLQALTRNTNALEKSEDYVVHTSGKTEYLIVPSIVNELINNLKTENLENDSENFQTLLYRRTESHDDEEQGTGEWILRASNRKVQVCAQINLSGWLTSITSKQKVVIKLPNLLKGQMEDVGMPICDVSILRFLRYDFLNPTLRNCCVSYVSKLCDKKDSKPVSKYFVDRNQALVSFFDAMEVKNVRKTSEKFIHYVNVNFNVGPLCRLIKEEENNEEFQAFLNSLWGDRREVFEEELRQYEKTFEIDSKVFQRTWRENANYVLLYLKNWYEKDDKKQRQKMNKTTD